MQTRSDLRTLIVGVVLGACLTASLGAAGVAGSSAGRFAMATNAGHVFILDTATGQAWQKFTPATNVFDSEGFSEAKIKGSKEQPAGKTK